ncbi:hypothetical protein [Paracoccus sp. N5]|uniref:hypothetical protein n=1 Tax=Paracoccus sp. N5 TaxID=1101189 RepID=UPI00037D7422|nr:hypothetical protein [Paracoccus sp. N5]
MDYIKENFDISDHQRRVSLWALDNFGRAARYDEVDGVKIDNPIEIASKFQASPEQACDLWARMIRHAYSRHSVFNGDVMVMKEAGKVYQKDFDRFEPAAGEVIAGEIIELWPRFTGHPVVLCLFEGMNPKDGLLVLDEDPEAAALLRQISDDSIRRILLAIREGRDRSYDFWRRALCDAEPLTEERIAAIRKEFDHSGSARDLIAMIRSCLEGRRRISPIGAAYVRQKLEAIKAA